MPIGAFKLNSIAAALSAAPITYISASGGTISYVTSGGVGYKVHSFTTAGTSTFTVTTGSNNLEAIILGAGGGSGGLSNQGTSQASGGGGGGQYRLQTGITVTAQNYSIVTGAGGTAGGNGLNGGFGSSSSAFGFTSVGGAGSKGTSGSTPASAGAAGGAGGGAFPGGIADSGSAGTLAGGNALNGQTATTIAAGGGGSNVIAGENGASGGLGATGAQGTQTYFNGSRLVLGGGGGGAGPSGNGSNSAGMGADAYHGNGANGVFTNSGVILGNAGTAGAVLIRYPMQTAFAVNFVTSTTSQTSTITIPATAAAGDIAILVDYGYLTSTTAPTAVTPTNWTSITTTSNTTSPAQRINVSYKTLIAGDPGSTITGINTTSMRKTMIIYRPTLTPNTIVPTGNFATSSASLIGTQFLAINTGKVVLSFAAYCTSGASIATRPSSRTATRELDNGTNMYVKTFEDQEGYTGSSNQISLADNGTNTLAIFNIVFS